MVDSRQNLTEQVANEVRAHFDGKVYDTTPAQRAPVRGAVVRQADPALRRRLEGRQELPRSGARAPGAQRQAARAQDAADDAAGDGGLAMSAPKRNALGAGWRRSSRARRRPAPPALATGIASRRAPRTAPERSPSRRSTPRPDSREARSTTRGSTSWRRRSETQGIIQPLIVRARRRRGGYELIAGERRWRAAQRAGCTSSRPSCATSRRRRRSRWRWSRTSSARISNPLEEAAGYQRLIEEFGYTQEQLSDRVGKDRSTVANALRLLRLPESVRGLLAEGRLSMGHARALLGLEVAAAMEKMARRMVVAASCRSGRSRSWFGARATTARRQEPAAARPAHPLGQRARPGDAPHPDARHAGRGPGGRKERGQIAIHYHSLDQLDALLERLMHS